MNVQCSLSFFGNRTDTRPTERTLGWSELVPMLLHHDRRATKDGPLFSPARFKRGTTRANGNVADLCLAVADFDHDADYEATKARLADYEYVSYSTYSSTLDEPRFRVVMPMLQDVPGEDWPTAWERINQGVFGGQNDPATKDQARMVYLPSCPPDALPFAEHHKGKLLDLDELPEVPKVTPSTNGNGHKPDSGIPLGKAALEFIALGAKVGGQRARALAAARNMLEAGRPVEEIIDRIWDGLQRSPEEPGRGPWKREDAEYIVNDLFKKPATAIKPLDQQPEAEATKTIPWPNPLDAAALHGLAGDIVRAIEPHTEADPAAILTQFIVAFGNAAGHRPHFLVESDRHTLNLFAVLVGDSAKGRKGTSWGHVRKVFYEADQGWALDCVVAGLSSGEGLIWAVRDQIVKTEPVKERGKLTGEYQEIIADRGVDDKRLFVLEGEFASPLKVMQREGSTLSPIMRQAWDHGDLRVLTKTSPARATGAHISIVGHITKDELLRYLDSTECGNGFANRFIWACVRRSKCLPEGGHIDEVDFSELIERLAVAIAFASGVDQIERDEEARAIWYQVYPDLSEGRPGLLGAVTTRAEAQVMRLACLYALLDRSDIIRKEHMLAALALWDYADASAKWIFGETLGDPMADELLRALRANPEGLTRADISSHFGRNKSAGQIQRALEALLSQGLTLMLQEDTGGRPAERWFAK